MIIIIIIRFFTSNSNINRIELIESLVFSVSILSIFLVLDLVEGRLLETLLLLLLLLLSLLLALLLVLVILLFLLLLLEKLLIMEKL